jgi:hypothetical protein
MKIILAALAIFLLAMFGMALGVLFGRRCIRGSCGGLAGMRDPSGRAMCDHCPSREADSEAPSMDGEAPKHEIGNA